MAFVGGSARGGGERGYALLLVRVREEQEQHWFSTFLLLGDSTELFLS